MKDIPIMFSAPMILGLDREAAEQGTGKSMTSRLAWGKPIGVDIDEEAARDMRLDGWKVSGPDDTEHRIAWRASPWQRVQVGQRLWVRENFWRFGAWAPKDKKGRYTFCPFDTMRRDDDPFPDFFFAADKSPPEHDRGKFAQAIPAFHLRPNIFLERAHSRFTLVVTDTKIRRLWDITEQECEREGCVYETADPPFWYVPGLPHNITGVGIEERSDLMPHAVQCFRKLWIHLHGRDGWETNPEIVALTFTVHKQNIDSLKQQAA